ncbi:MAG TPA: cation-translocating P-type ATPase [Chthoniobacterales bacterium]
MFFEQETPARADGLWPHIARIIARHPELKRIRLKNGTRQRGIALGFYEPPSEATLERIESAVRAELSEDWDVQVEPDRESPVIHLHKIDNETAEFHRAHPLNEPAVIWRRMQLPRWRNRPFPRPVPRDYRVMLLLAAICGVSALAGFSLSRIGFYALVTAFCFMLAYVAGGWFAAQDMWQALKQRKIDIQFLMVAVAMGALFVGAQTEGATLLFLFSLSNGLEQFANHRTRKSIASLLKVAPKQILRRADDRWVEVSIEQVDIGDELLVKPGELFPVDGVIVEGATSVDESALTGEAIPVFKQIGDAVDGGTLNLEGRSIIRATRELEDSALSRIVALIEEAQQQKAPSQRFTDGFSRYYTWVALALAAAVFVVLLASGRPASAAFYRSMTVLVVASPCALVLSIPSAILVAIAAAARRGILFRGGVAIENLGAANRFAFDKTGTLTKGSLVVARISGFNSEHEHSVVQTAASVAHSSTHPLARAIVAEAEKQRIALRPVQDFLNVPGLGMEATVNGRRIFVGSRKFMHDRGVALPAVELTNDAEVWIGSSHLLGIIYLRDEVRAASARVIDFLKHSGAAVTLLTGDRAGPAAIVAEHVGITDVRAELSPQAKLKCIHNWRAAGERVAMVGDGINDAPSLTAADVSIGMGARGSDAALEQADVILMHDKIDNVEDAFRLSRAARAIIRQNITISLGVVLFLIISALAEKINLTAGVIGHEGSTVLVVLNGLRLLRDCASR